VAASNAVRLWYPTPAVLASMIQQGLPIGNGRLGGLVGGDPGNDAVYITDGTMWTGSRNNVPSTDGQLPYDTVNFGTLSQLAHLTVQIPDHALASVTGYQRALDISNGLVTASYVRQGVTYQREVYASHPDDAVVLSFTNSGGGAYNGQVILAGARGETVNVDPPASPSPSALPFPTAGATAPPSPPSAAAGRSRSAGPVSCSPTVPT